MMRYTDGVSRRDGRSEMRVLVFHRPISWGLYRCHHYRGVYCAEHSLAPCVHTGENVGSYWSRRRLRCSTIALFVIFYGLTTRIHGVRARKWAASPAWRRNKRLAAGAFTGPAGRASAKPACAGCGRTPTGHLHRLCHPRRHSGRPHNAHPYQPTISRWERAVCVRRGSGA